MTLRVLLWVKIVVLMGFMAIIVFFFCRWLIIPLRVYAKQIEEDKSLVELGDIKELRLVAKDSLLACAKHYIGYGAAEGGRDYHRTEISDYSLFNYYLPAFRAAVKAGAKTVMSSFNDINGQPVTSSKYYLDQILRGELGFDGFVVSDYDAVIQLQKQGVSPDDATCAAMALNAGLDMDMHDKCYIEHLEALVQSGKVSQETVDNAVRRVLSVKLRKGLFEHPYCEGGDYDEAAHRRHAREIARESMVLLKNEKGLLPLAKDTKICLIGPFATEKRSLLGSWCIDGKTDNMNDLLTVLRETCTGKVVYSSGSGLNWDSSLKNAYNADVVVLALGESWTATGEARSVSDIAIPPEQRALIQKIKAAGKPVIGVIFCGRPIAMGKLSEELDAILYAWHSGTCAAEAVCDLLFGEVSPSGKLPATLPRLATHIPLYYNITSSGRPVDCYYDENPGNCYVDSIPTPCYTFGYGLSYAKFEYKNIGSDRTSVSAEELKNGQKVTVFITLKNVGEFDGKETVQLYMQTPVASRMRPLRELKAYQKVFLKHGEETGISFALGMDEMGYYDEKGNYVVEKGVRRIFVGDSCYADKKIEIEIV